MIAATEKETGTPKTVFGVPECVLFVYKCRAQRNRGFACEGEFA